MTTIEGPRRLYRVLAAAAVIVGFGLRLPTPGLPPPGLYRDEAHYGIDAAGVLDGDLRLYFPANNGREPLFIYVVSGFVAILDRAPAAPRLASAFVGTAAIAAAFAAGSVLVGPRAAVLVAALVAVAPWPVLLGRVGLRAGLLPLVLSLAVAATVKGARGGDRRMVALGGGLAGLTVYTYVAAWAGVVFLAIVAAWWMARRQSIDRRAATSWIVAAAIVALPLVLTYASRPESAVGRALQVSVLDDAAGVEGVRRLASSAARAAGLFVWQGDDIARHNVPGRPALAPLGAAAWLVGLAVLLGRSRRDVTAAVVPAWLVAMLLPTALADDAPHFLRAVGLLPAAFVPAAVGIVWVGDRVRAVRAGLGWVGPVLGLLVVGGELSSTLGYLAEGRAGDAVPGRAGGLASRLHYDFESGAAALASDVNGALGVGWRGGWSGAGGSAGDDPDRPAVWLDRRLRDGWAAVPYLVPTERLTLADPYDPVLTTLPGRAYLWPHDLDLAGIWSRRAPAMRLTFRPGSRERGDLEAEPRLLYIVAEGTPAETVTDPIGRFANGLLLADVGILLGTDAAAGRPVTVTVETEWSLDHAIDRDVTAFVQVLDGDTLLAGSDAPLGQGRFPVPFWRPGDRVVERRVLEVPGGIDPNRHRIVVGTYEWPSVAPIRVVLQGGVEADHVVVWGARRPGGG